MRELSQMHPKLWFHLKFVPLPPLERKIKQEMGSMEVSVAPPKLETEQPMAVTNGKDLSHISCQVCLGSARNHHKVVCSKCSLVVHYDCFLLEAISNDWTCDWCLNLSNKQYSMNSTCVICHIPSAQAPTCMKPTSKFNWVHVSCALLMMPLYLNKGEVTGVSDLDLSSWKERCKVCHEHKGFKVACRFCPTHLVHPICSVSNNSYHVGFDNSLVPSVICPAHSNIPPSKALDSIDSNTRKSIMSIHLQTRALPAPSSEPETSMPVSNGGTFHSLIPRLQLICSTCGVDSSPLWWWPGPRGNLSGTLCPYLPSFDSRASSGEADLAPITTLQCHICRWNHLRPLPQNTPPMQPANAM
ncbi:putative PHD type zinc finger protein with BAH domain-containing protein [Entomophthora muscae]|uniref:PHD type zinc finger protein with BAH domain-containing protein n=1 Tax=Entomophthora muscae TaxID=34485 RepID=A0ACC2TFA5_9FUNG|nr:putative PHD type zinc finger protein with BAH domain-containing protein [Entomophthora muscae]